jgi:hypothetical protein
MTTTISDKKEKPDGEPNNRLLHAPRTKSAEEERRDYYWRKLAIRRFNISQLLRQ